MLIATVQDKLRTSIFNLACKVFRSKRIFIDEGLNLAGTNIFQIRKDCSLRIGKNVFLNSRNNGYHINMHSPNKFFADRPGASIIIGENTRIHGSCVHAYTKISIGMNCLIAANCQIFDGNGHDLSFDEPQKRIFTFGSSKEIIIEDNVWIGANSIILPGTHIGNGSVICAGSVVRGEIP